MKFLIPFFICSFGISSTTLADDNSVHPAHPRQCYSCEGINCQRTSRLNVNVTCTDILDICITIFEDYAVIAKGCYLDMPEYYRRKCDDHNNPECSKCYGQLCNNKGREDFKCIECNDNLNCDKNTSAMKAVQCSIPTAPNSYCFVRKDGTKTQRGCMVHLNDQMKCLSDQRCSMCLANDGIACNSYNIDITAETSKAANLAISSYLCAILILVTIIGLLR